LSREWQYASANGRAALESQVEDGQIDHAGQTLSGVFVQQGKDAKTTAI
jgi:hypothetical protein